MAKPDYNCKEHKEWRRVILSKFNNKCIICGGTHRLTAHHLISARVEKFRYNENNGIPLCATHHTKYGDVLSPHSDNAMIFFIFLKNNFPNVVKWVEESGYEI